MSRPLVLLGYLGVATFLAYGCSSSSSGGGAQGGEGQACFPNGTCNAGLTCYSNLCVNAGADGGDHDAGGGSDGTASDASDANFDASGTNEAAADATPTDASDAPAFSVGSLPGLVIWLDAAKGVTKDASNIVSAWADQSGTSYGV